MAVAAGVVLDAEGAEALSGDSALAAALERIGIVEDPDGNPVGLMSPIDAELRHWPPAPPPPGT